jgi:hypothetical protein
VDWSVDATQAHVVGPVNLIDWSALLAGRRFYGTDGQLLKLRGINWFGYEVRDILIAVRPGIFYGLVFGPGLLRVLCCHVLKHTEVLLPDSFASETTLFQAGLRCSIRDYF